MGLAASLFSFLARLHSLFASSAQMPLAGITHSDLDDLSPSGEGGV